MSKQVRPSYHTAALWKQVYSLAALTSASGKQTRLLPIFYLSHIFTSQAGCDERTADERRQRARVNGPAPSSSWLVSSLEKVPPAVENPSVLFMCCQVDVGPVISVQLPQHLRL